MFDTASAPKNYHKPLVALVMYGKSSTEKIARTLNILNVEYILVHPEITPQFDRLQPTHIILSGGPKHVYNPDTDNLPQWVIDSPCPVLAICFGMQLVAKTFGGTVVRMMQKEEGPIDVTEIIRTSPNSSTQVTTMRWMNRHDQVIHIPEMFDITGVTNANQIAAFTDHKKWWAVQYHPESYKHGDMSIFKQFLKKPELRITSLQDSNLISLPINNQNAFTDLKLTSLPAKAAIPTNLMSSSNDQNSPVANPVIKSNMYDKMPIIPPVVEYEEQVHPVPKLPHTN